MSCAARYSETTSLEFILNPFKFFFTNYVAKIAPHSPPDIPHLETKFRPPTILHSYRSNCTYTSLPFPRALPPYQHSEAVLLIASASVSCLSVLPQYPAILPCAIRYVHRTIPLLYRTACLHTRTLLLKARTPARFMCPATFFLNARHKRSVYTNSGLLHVRGPVMRHVNAGMYSGRAVSSVRQCASGFVPRPFTRRVIHFSESGACFVPPTSLDINRAGGRVSRMHSCSTG
ncbi:hypothetical protein CJU94_14055 [Paraburkholderia aromaticivorans]|uniref:Uncharacterized protein n=1 Tax=Paraburkholderia aromaticivorans TaxID=2026199 RepID=A0A248VJM1_9BURK|nr:hypothetical protein CJU94_14055 [Paraburkholderia aromaticivorans]